MADGKCQEVVGDPMSLLVAASKAPEIDYMGLSPVLALVGGAVLALIVGLFPGRVVQRGLVPLVGAASLLTAGGLSIANWETGDSNPIIAGALAIDTLALLLSLLFFVMGLATIVLSLRADVTREAGAGEYMTLLLSSILGMVILAGAENLVTLFIGLELLSIPLYVLCAAETRRATSLESGLKYLVIGSVGSATLLYGLALVYGATGDTDFQGIADAVGDSVSVTDPLLLTGVALVTAGLAFKASVAPFHQWTPDVYQGAPTPVTSFMAVATKVAAFAILLRFLDHALPSAQTQWAPWLAVLAVTTILIGNTGAIAQDSLKRMLAWSGVAQAGYLLAGVVVGTRLGLQAVCFYLIAYLFMNVAAFAVVTARERVSEHGDGAGVAARPGRGEPVAGLAHDHRDAVAGRLPRHRRLHREVLFDRRRRGRRLRLAGHRHRGRLDDLAGLLPARAGRDVDGQLLGRAAHPARAHGQGREGLVARGRRQGPARGGGGRRPGRRGDRGVRDRPVAPVRPVPRRGHVAQLDALRAAMRFETQDEWRDWLAANHADHPDGVWIEMAKKASGIASITHPEAVEVALCFGWIDSQRKGVDDQLVRPALHAPPRAQQVVTADVREGRGADRLGRDAAGRAWPRSSGPRPTAAGTRPTSPRPPPPCPRTCARPWTPTRRPRSSSPP